MRKTAIAVGLLVISASTSVGCKSTQKLAWWKSNKTDETALAHAAPELPSDAAKKAEGTQVAGGAAPFKPANAASSSSVSSKSGSNYPSTDAPAFTPGAVTQVAANTTTKVGATTNPGMAGPYDPAATPAPKASIASLALPGADRYGSGTSGATAPVPGSPNYGQAPSSETDVDPSHSPIVDVGGVTNRYGLPPVGTTPTPPTAPGNTPVPPNAGASMAATQSYRPGGTSTYNVSVATRPPSSSASASTSMTRPEAEASSTSTAPTVPLTTPSTSTNRYW